MARTREIWADVVKCPSCGAANDARDEWCETCLADIPADTAGAMFVRRWRPGRTSERD